VNNLPNLRVAFAALVYLLAPCITTAVDRGPVVFPGPRIEWVAAENGPGCVNFLVVDPTNSSVLFGFTGQPVLPGFIDQPSDLHRSVDGGRNWTPVKGPQPYVVSLQVSPARPSTVYAVAQGFYRSDDGGVTWFRVITAPEDLNGPLVIDPFSPETLYVGNTCCGQAAEIPEVWVSHNGGTYWIRMDNGLPHGDGPHVLKSLIADPRMPGLLLASLNDGVYRTTDGGENWSRISDVVVGRIWGFDADSSNVVWASGVDSAFRSSDGGATWTPVQVFFSPHYSTRILTMLVDPVAPGTIYAGTDQNGVLRTANGGETWWFFGDYPILASPSVRSFAFDTAGSTLWAAGCDYTNTVYRLDLQRPRTVPVRDTSGNRPTSEPLR
jgi:photosystem II stability/assembly factor-like uncharacterized protein